MRRRTAAAVVSLALLSSISCTSGEPDPRSVAVTPTRAAAAEFEPITQRPRDTRTVEGPTFTLWAPAQFQQSERPGPDGIPLVVLAKPAEGDGVVEVVALDEESPQASAAEQISVLAAQKRDLADVDDFERLTVDWPGAASGVVAQWTEETETASGTLRQRFVQLSLDVDADVEMLGQERITTVVAVAPAGEFESSGALEVLRTLRLDSG